MMTNKIILRVAVIFLYCQWFSTICNGQSIVSGRVLDFSDQSPLVGATVACGDFGTYTNEEGRFQIEIFTDCELMISYIGYETKIVSDLNSLQDITIYLRESSNNLDLLTVTGSKYERRLSETTVSVEVLKPDFINKINTSKSDELLNKLPGVQVVGGQANIRGGSGFSYGAGSRVMVLMDDIPVMQTDAGLANWGDMPIESIDQIEVLKGAASTLYGSSALNGVINFKRLTPSSKPKTRGFISYNQFMDPQEIKYKWWGDTTKYRVNLGFAHARKIGKLDLTVHGFYTKYDSYAKETYEKKGRAGLDLKYNFSNHFQAGLNFMINKANASDFFIWRNALRGIYEPYAGTVSQGIRTRIQIDPFIIINDKHQNKHKLQSRIFYTNNENNANQANSSTTTFGEYQFQRDFTKQELLLTSGIVYSSTNSDAELFGNSSFLYTNAAAYLQLEKKVNNNLSLSGGLRYEFNNQESPDTFLGFVIPGGRVKDDQFIARLGANYKIGEYSSLRASWGQGYRYPTVTERFISTNFGGFTIFPNPLLKPEFGWSSEIGIKQGFRVAAFEGYLDLSGFISEYQDMIEFTFQQDPLGFQPINVGNTSVPGVEFSVMGKVNILKVPISLLGGVTFIDPKYKNFEENDLLRSTLSTDQNVLKYRSKTSYKIDAQADYLNFSLGIGLQYYGHMINIDQKFEEPVDGSDIFQIGYFRSTYNKGFTTVDARLSYSWHAFKAGIYASNLFNIAYTVRPGLLEAPRNFSIRFDYNID